MSLKKSRSPWIDNLRSSITILVIAHHAALAYTTFASFNAVAYILSTHPVVDPKRWYGFNVFVSYNDTFFMSLMFLISGIFVVKGVVKKGAWSFITERLNRLFVPFLAAVTVLMMIAYYPAYLLSEKPSGVANFAVDFFTIEAWPVGPPWFIWMLFAFNVVFVIFRKALVPWLQDIGTRLQATPTVSLFLSVMVIAIFAYLPLAIYFGAYSWTGFGPFDFQLSRVLLYFIFFLIGASLGTVDFNSTVFRAQGRFATIWPVWLAGSLLTFILYLNFPEFVALFVNSDPDPSLLAVGSEILFIVTGTLTMFFFLAAFRTFANRESLVWRSLSENAYGMYLIHYIFITWSQYELIGSDLHPLLKFLTVFVVSSSASWLATTMLRKIKFIARYV
jgi:acyltransferase-like protein